MQDLLRNKAERYFAVNYPSVVEIHFAQRKDTGANDDQYIGFDKERVLVAWVYLEDLNRWSGVALDAIRDVTYNVGTGEENEKRVFNNLMNHGWSTRFGNESAQPTIMDSSSLSVAAQDLLNKLAKDWFVVNCPGVSHVEWYGGHPLCSAGFFGYSDSGKHIAYVPMKMLEQSVSIKPNTKALFVLQYAFNLNKEQAEHIRAKLGDTLKGLGYETLVIDCMSESKVQAFGIDTPHINSMSLDEIEALLDGVRRAREAGQGGNGDAFAED